MFKTMYLRWRYRRARKHRIEGSATTADYLMWYCAVLRHVSFHKTTYKERVRLDLRTRFKNAEHFLSFSRKLLDLCRVRSFDVEQLYERFDSATTHPLDIWLTDHRGIPVDEVAFGQALVNVALDFHDLLTSIRDVDKALYDHYNKALRYYLSDLVRVLEAYAELQLGVDDDVGRHAQTLISAR